MSDYLTLEALSDARCESIQIGTEPLDASRTATLLKLLPDWSLDGSSIVRTVRFKNYHKTIEFVNDVARVAHDQDHHPDMEVGYNRCVVKFSTHDVRGLSEKDFICAAGVERVVQRHRHKL